MNGQYYEDFCETYGGDDHEYDDMEDGLFQQAQTLTSPIMDDFYYYEDDADISSPTPVPRRGIADGLSYSEIELPYGRPSEASLHSVSVMPSSQGRRLHNTLNRRANLTTDQYERDPPSRQENSYQGLDAMQNSSSDSRYTTAQREMAGPRTTNPRNSHGIRLRPVSDLPDIYRGIFKFGVFNAVQSRCFDDVMTRDKNIVISAPTGSGKTVLFELGIIRMLDRSKKTEKQVKCVYIAPTKALCSERFQDWATKFEPIGLKCCELTGDTVVFGQNAWGEAKSATIIVTTCEKWDSLTRNWHDHEQILGQIQLFLVDEVHILNESRGSTLEVVTSRMKLRGSSIRFILVSATVPNIDDVAFWIESGAGQSGAAQVYEFGEEFRPCQLTRHVVGIPRRQGQNDFQFAKILDYKLFSILQEYSVGKPILVFCSTRKGVFGTADQLLKEFVEGEGQKKSLPWSRPARISHSFADKRLDAFASAGIGLHHAGLSMDDRRATEHLYVNKTLRVLIATSTLAVGVNLPAHMVVIKGVRTFQNNLSKEYSDLDIMQMLGRAGRPQFDKDGIAIILCESDAEQKYRALMQGNTVLESSLHINLAEHLNSEIGLGTVTNVDSAKKWLSTSFLYRRMQKNPGFYALDPGFVAGVRGGNDIDDVVMKSIAQLKETQLIEHVEQGVDAGKLSSTEYGEIMSKYYIRRGTMDLILGLEHYGSLRQILEVISGAEEFQDIKLRASEKTVFNKLRNDPDIRFEIKKVEKTADKIFLLVQAVLGGVNLNEYKSSESQPQMEALVVFKHIARIARAVLDIAVVKKDGCKIKYGFELFRCLSAKAWEDRAIVLRQIDHIGEKSIKVLAEHGITSFAALRKQNTLRIETLLGRRPPFGLDVLSSVAEFPQYILDVKEIAVHSDGGKSPVQLDLRIECSLMEENLANPVKQKKQRARTFQMTAVLTLTSDLDLIDFRRIPTKALKGGKSFEVVAELKKPSQTVIVIVAPETIAGVASQHAYKPNVPPDEYPVLDTRPLSSVDMDLLGLEEDPDFWNMTLDSGSAVGQDQLDNEDLPKKLEKQETNKKIVSELPVRSIAQGKENIKIRSDGKYECNHPCKDKSKCRHLCCREGLTEPKKKAQSSQDAVVRTPNTSTVERQHPPSSSFMTTQKKEKRCIADLGTIHDRAQVTQNFQLSEGRRLKIEPSRPPKRKRLPIEYDVSFTDLTDPQVAYSSDVSATFSDSDDLPEAILSVKGVENNPDQTECPSSTSLIPERQSKHTAFPKKRIKVQDRVSSTTLPTSQSDGMLFLSDSDDSVEIVTPAKLLARSKNTGIKQNKIKTGDQEFQLAGKEKISMAPVRRNLSSSTLDVSGVHTDKIRQDTTIEDIQTVPTVQSPIQADEEFAELDAWLQSGSVDIL